MASQVYAVIMAGGSGTRFWPLSRNHRPKQLLDLFGSGTLIQATVARLQPLIPPERVLVVTTAALAEATRRQLPQVPAEQIIAEPVGRDTAACVCLAALVVERLSPGATMILLPADQVIEPADAFQAALAAGAEVAGEGHLVTYGIVPRAPATGYGYLRLGTSLPARQGVAVHTVEAFVEKPDLATAKRYLAEGRYRWNAGIFTWRTDVVLTGLAEHCGWLIEALRPVSEAWATPDFLNVLSAAYGPLRKISIDYALMEHAKDVVAIDGAFAWDDVGSWDALCDHLPADEAGVLCAGDTLAIDCEGSLLYAGGRQIVAGVGLKDLMVIATDDAVLVLRRGQGQDVKRLVEALKAAGRPELL